MTWSLICCCWVPSPFFELVRAWESNIRMSILRFNRETKIYKKIVCWKWRVWSGYGVLMSLGTYFSNFLGLMIQFHDLCKVYQKVVESRPIDEVSLISCWSHCCRVVLQRGMGGRSCSKPQMWLMCFNPWVYLRVQPPLGLVFKTKGTFHVLVQTTTWQNLGPPPHGNVRLFSPWKNKMPIAKTIIWDSWSWVEDLTTSLSSKLDIGFCLSGKLNFHKHVHVNPRLVYFEQIFSMVQYFCYSNLTQRFPKCWLILILPTFQYIKFN